MLRGIYKYGLALCLCLTVSLLWAQKKTDRDYLRSGNRLYRDSMYTKAEVDYRKAIEANSRFPQAHFNLGNALLRQQKPKVFFSDRRRKQVVFGVIIDHSFC